MTWDIPAYRIKKTHKRTDIHTPKGGRSARRSRTFPGIIELVHCIGLRIKSLADIQNQLEGAGGGGGATKRVRGGGVVVSLLCGHP